MSTKGPHHHYALASSLAACLGSVASAVFAALLTLAPYPAPGGNTAAYVGEPIELHGRVWSLGSFDPTAYTNLYYGIGDYAPAFPDFVPGVPTLTMDGGTADALAFKLAASNLANGVAVWSGSTLVPSPERVVYTRFVLTVTDTSDNALALTDASTLGLPPALGGVLDVSGDFDARWQFMSSFSINGPFEPAKTFFDRETQSDGLLVSSVGGAFYSTPPAAVPEPATFALTLVGVGLLGFVARRRKTPLNSTQQ